TTPNAADGYSPLPACSAGRHSPFRSGVRTMKRRFRKLDPAIEVDLGQDVMLYARSIEDDKRGGIISTIEAWNGTRFHADRVNLTLELQRRSFAKKVSDQVPAVRQAAVELRLLELGGSLSVLFDEPAPDEQTPPPDTDALLEQASDLANDPELLN